ncbi:MAG: endolytic transglycosylase MltG [Myxococcota bacterium]
MRSYPLPRVLTLLCGLLLFACLPGDGNVAVDPGNPEPVVFEVPKGASGGGLGAKLVREGLVSSEFNWKIFLKRGADASCIKAGKFQLSRAMTMTEILAALCGPPLADDVPFLVVEGWRIRDIDKELADKGWIEAGQYADVTTNKSVEPPFPVESPTYEGYLYPETYMVPNGEVDVKRLVARQLETFQERFLSKHPDGFGKRTLHQIVVVASMLEREEPKPENRPIVAGIIYKRLDRNFGLGIDATSHYKLENWNDRKGLLAALRDENDPYNTRLKPGLPPTAIGNPTLASLEAAVAPQASEWLYYLHDKDGNIHPARTAAEHEANRKKFGVY